MLIVSLTVVGLMAGQASILEPGDHTRLLTVDGLERAYIVHIPARRAGGPGWPAVLAFHGGSSNAQAMISFSGLSEKADEAGFLAVYPSGTGRTALLLTWNAGNCCGYAERHQVDDVKFVRAVLDDLTSILSVDPRRVYATGISNGAMLCYRLAAEMSERIAAIAPVAGPMGTESCWPSQAVSVCHFHGTDDQFAPFAGGVGRRSVSRTRFFSVEHSIQAWVRANGCDPEPQRIDLPVLEHDGTRVRCTAYRDGKGRSEVVLYTIEGGGHTWPGRPSRTQFLGTTTKNLRANDAMWDFFQRHAR